MTNKTIGIEDRVKAAYENGSTIRHIAAAEGRPYAAIRGILLRSRTPLRGRGGDTRSAKTSTPAGGAG